MGAAEPDRSGDPVPATGVPEAPGPVRALTPAGAVGLAAAVAGGCLVAHPLSLLVPGAVGGVALLLRRPLLLVVAAALAASALGARAEAGLAPPDRASVDAEVTLVSDPEVRFGRVEAIARLRGRLVLVEADGPAADVVAVRLAGERVRVAGRLGPPPADAPWLRVRHVSGAVEVSRAAPGAEAAPPWRVANRVRRVLAAGAEHMGDDRRSLYLGLVLGDDRDQPPTLTDDFRGSGLSHLLAVSGQNVAFVLALAGPALRRLTIGWRVLAVAGLLGLFVVLTRGEPSVLRAVAMAGGAAVAAARGRPTPGLQLLGLAVAGCLLVDPLLVGSVGFHLSVAATLGILVIGPRLAAVVPGPPAIVLPVAVTAAAQLGVAPLVVASFDGVPVAGLVANVLAAPSAAVVMTWGLPAGFVAGLAPAPLDAVLHLPTRLALGWLSAVARGAASAPLGLLGGVEVAVLALAAGLAVVAGRWSRPGPARLVAAVVAAAALAAPAIALRHPPPHVEPVPGVEVWRAGATVVVVAPGTGPTAVLEGLRRAGVTRVDLLVLGPAPTAGDEERAARHRARVRRVWWMGRDPPGTTRLGRLSVATDGERAAVARVR
ncbi:ComEC/Rec2 family competence protein [Iamia sp. SCSIO 61187]|uniref:ComEC/Rec2 family competence protein n=1 Tax=Iamia sp. SCSIO 61187 TaxID=2722752 RepID=UPI001C633ADC|nr:ComEC/Rec2 family competence protein [Iamia sp. SCSIO 61187]QYG93716.1 ComEC/Rec2 family competence protein [Iamia sp. SCSIO 61187]